MPNLFQSIFRRPIYQQYIYPYDKQVHETVSFQARSNQQLEALYTTIVEVRIIEDFIGDFISRIPAGVVDSKGNEVKFSKLNHIIEQANTEQSFQELLKEFLVSYGLTGNGYLLLNNDMLYSLLSSATSIELGKSVHIPEWDNYVKRYIQEYEGYTYPLESDKVFHMKTANMQDMRGSWVYGSSPYASAEPNLVAIESNNSARVATIRDRGALGFLTNDGEYPDEDATKDAQKKISEGGITEGKDKILVTTQKLRYQKMSLSMEELQLIDNLEIDWTRLCSVRGIDPMIFSSAGAKYANQKEAYRLTVKRALLPLAYHVYDKFNLFIKEHFPTTNRIIPKVDELPDYADLQIEQSAKVIDEVNAGILSRSQGLEILYPDLTWIEDTPVAVQTVIANQGGGTSDTSSNGEADEEDKTQARKKLNFTLS